MKPLVVVGDCLLDVDIEGVAERLCPEAPVPVVDVERRWLRPGGAGLAAALAAQSVPRVSLVTATADDRAGRTLAQLLDLYVDVVALPLRGETVRKTRVRAAGQSLLRLDTGSGTADAGSLNAAVTDTLRSAGAILVADYGRGVAAHPQIRRLLTELARTVPVVWDPHPRGPAPTPGATLVTPNWKEARQFAPGYLEPDELAKVLRDEWSADSVAVTTGSDGAVLANGKQLRVVPVPTAVRVASHARSDTCGAGDRFASAATAALLDGATVADAVSHAVETAARFVAAGGAATLSTCDRVPITKTAAQTNDSAFEVAARIRAQGGRLVATGGCFDLLHPGHVSLLRQAREMGDALVVCLNSDASVRNLKGPRRPILTARDRARLLSELSSVDAVVVFDEPTPSAVLDRLRPDVWVKGGDYTDVGLPEAEVVRGYGGEIALIPTVPGYSTTQLVAAAQAH
ncbi:rfaE bifunctional protein kinase chain/domain/rfaE bifunctional protein nucleotidyltransferase chain/domain [Nocardia tenerifensis]|uniref:RfaE bifunctional protein kinase chain/domain/rfaE bifunctional protein nucleotidyltransferase chain/domain n=1 Tax=Nocardia tenerifensis TaxID=228006 RepID=A0A318KKI7_9NOCA|nr:PfkB family carbohydrate kinase [Nocardia tenerifensis]PXX68917.1 rfaE bifunctional protein kinase chain/domain/rfaE bifunctional protein nucleotidyltransferase chain/domain [Nocardia tenerifensis]